MALKEQRGVAQGRKGRTDMDEASKEGRGDCTCMHTFSIAGDSMRNTTRRLKRRVKQSAREARAMFLVYIYIYRLMYP